MTVIFAGSENWEYREVHSAMQRITPSFLNQKLPNDLLIMDMRYENRRTDNLAGGYLEGKGKAAWEGMRRKCNDM